MIDSITGYVERLDEAFAVISTGGVGYALCCSALSLSAIAAGGEQVKVYTYLSVNDSGITLYGFHETDERDAFLKLITVPKVGPKVALSILSVYTPNELYQCISANDIKAMSIPSGVGKKMAENIILNLKDKLSLTETYASAQNSTDAAFGIKSEAVAALVALGFDRASAFSAVNDAYEEGANEEYLIRKGLSALSR